MLSMMPISLMIIFSHAGCHMIAKHFQLEKSSCSHVLFAVLGIIRT